MNPDPASLTNTMVTPEPLPAPALSQIQPNSAVVSSREAATITDDNIRALRNHQQVTEQRRIAREVKLAEAAKNAPTPEADALNKNINKLASGEVVDPMEKLRGQVDSQAQMIKTKITDLVDQVDPYTASVLNELGGMFDEEVTKAHNA